MSFSLWHWLIVAVIAALAFRRRLSQIFLFLTDPGRASREFLGILNAKDREAMLEKQTKLRQRWWILVAVFFLLVISWKASRYWTG
jgi:Sec-independent protein translocase protein TatA